MTLPLHPLDPDLFARALPLLDEEWLTRDPELAPLLPTVLARNVGQDWHKAGTFRHHLVGVTRTLTVWQQPRDVRLLGLLHSVYGNAFVDLVKFDPAKERARVREIAGESAEHLVYLFCTQSRTQFVQKVLAHALEADGSLVLQKDGQDHVLTPYEVAAFIIVSMADTIEQWFSWQDDIFSRFPEVQHRNQKAHWAASLWPGPMRPSGRMVHQINGLAKALQHPGLKDVLPMPPVFAHCSQYLSAANEAAATSLYWSVIQQDQPLVCWKAPCATTPGWASRRWCWPSCTCRPAARTTPSPLPRVRCTCSAPGAMRGTSACSGTPGWPGRASCCRARRWRAPGPSGWTS
jgi:hypothetical protein